MVTVPQSSSSFCFVLCFPIYYHILHCFLTICSLLWSLISFLFQFVTVRFSIVVFLGLPALHVIFLPCNSIVPRFSPYYCLFWIYVFCNYILNFPSFSFSHLAHADVLLCLAATPVRISSHTEIVSSNLHRLLQSSILPTTCINHTAWRHVTQNLSPSTLFLK